MPIRPPEPGRESPRRLAAELIYDTGTQSLPRGLCAVSRRSRCLFFVAEDFEIMLEVLPESSPDRRSLTGGLMKDGRPLTDARVRLDGPIQRCLPTTGRDGAFRWSGLPRGDYALEIEAGQHLLVLPALNLDAA